MVLESGSTTSVSAAESLSLAAKSLTATADFSTLESGGSGHGYEVGHMPQKPTQMCEDLSVRFALGEGGVAKGQGLILHGLRRRIFLVWDVHRVFLTVGKVHNF